MKKLYVLLLAGAALVPLPARAETKINTNPICEHGKFYPCWYIDWEYTEAANYVLQQKHVKFVYTIKFNYDELTPEERDYVTALRAKLDKKADAETDRTKK